MVKNKSSFLAKLGRISVIMLRITEIAAILFIITAGLWIWKNPQYIAGWLNIKPSIVDETAKINSIKIDALNSKMENLSLIVRSSSEQSELLKQNFSYFNKSKADAAEIININNEIHSVRNQLSKLGKTSNRGALILTAAMLIRDNTTHGNNCKNEAEALKILSDNDMSIQENVEFITSHCNINFYSQTDIINQFNEIYNQIKNEELKNNESFDWKQRLMAKINEYIKISTPKDKDSDTYNLLQALRPIKKLADSGDLAGAARLIKNQENTPLFENEKIKNWYQQIETQMEFYKNLSDIIANSLLIMKVENAKNTTEKSL